MQQNRRRRLQRQQRRRRPERRKLLEILNVRVVGSGDRIVVFSHGFGTDQSAWNRVLPYFQRDYRVVLYDLICAGSVNPDHFDFGRYKGLDAYVDDLLAILDALRIDRCFFVGHSVSAMIGVHAAIRRPTSSSSSSSSAPPPGS
uniref:AB hydrolase-1 domain-containing protein n=1 Tax=Ananas comosus var. bracteatus TaxID=296719 RepID=A0A6V7Q477_ANACO|nr:unnamed protein product [Ananas comosus var. bracteatus]